MKKVLVLSFSNLSSDPRVNRQLRFLQEDYEILAAGFSHPQIKDITFINARGLARKSLLAMIFSAFKLLSQRFENYYWQKNDVVHCLEQLNNIEVDLIIANDIDTLPIALKIAKKAKVIFDAHEYSPLEFEDQLFFRLFYQKYKTYLCQRYIPQVNSMTTVCQSIADRYKEETGLKATIITNAPDYEELYPNFNHQNEKISLVHHGGASPSRKLENMIRMMDYLDDRFELNLILVGGDSSYFKYLKKLIKNKENIKFLQPVPMRDLSKFLNSFDMGLYILEPNSFNNRYALPNKLFEFIQARLGIAVGPSPEMAKIVNQYDCGIVSTDFSPKSMASCLMRLDHKKLNYYKQRSHEIAHQMSAIKNQTIFLELVKQTIMSTDTRKN